MARPDSSAAELSVAELTRLVKGLLESDSRLNSIWVRGEASNVRLASSGHLYFTLKDASAQLAIAWFGFGNRRTKPPAEGEALLVHGSVRVYERSGQYQLVADDFIRAGQGDLAARFEALKQKLAAEGLFDEARKRRPPALPRRIAVVTSPTTAALQDVLNVLRRRAPYLSVVLFPAAVQGEAAPPEIIAALRRADSMEGIETILLVRGGGSIEDLWCFNDEALARAIVALERPLICGVGHEIDFTIADFVADLRAPTPSAAAELVAPDRNDLRAALDNALRRMIRGTGTTLGQHSTALSRLFDRRLLRDVASSLNGHGQSVDALAEEMVQLAASAVQLDGTAGYSEQLERLHRPLARRLEQAEYRLPQARTEMLRALRVSLGEMTAALKAQSGALQGLDPRAPTKLGFALVWGSDGKLVREADSVAPGERLRIEVQNGTFEAERKNAEV